MKAPGIGILCLLPLLGACPKAGVQEALDAGATDGILGTEGSSEGASSSDGMGLDLFAGADVTRDDARRGDTSSIDGGMPRGVFAEVKTWKTSNHLKLYVFRPGSPTKDPSLVVALHGCGQNAKAYEAAGWSALADQRGFYVVYPQTADHSGCFPWFDLNENRRGVGVAEEIASMTRWAMKLQ